MKRVINILFFFLVFKSILAGTFIYQNKDQQWVLTDVRSNNHYTAIYCDIFILNDRAGCFDAHDTDKLNSSIYIYGEFGKLNLVSSEFNGDYKPWEVYSQSYEWKYYKKFQRGRVAHAVFYFPRIPAGVDQIGWHFNGGWACEAAPSDKYRTPNFDIKNISIKDNPNLTPHTGWSERQLKQYWATNNPAPIEGIYNFLSTSNSVYWGDVRHKIAIKKNHEQYQIIYLHGSNNAIWKEGELKAIFSPTTSKGIYKIEQWYLDNKMLSTNDLYVDYSADKITIYDVTSHIETIFIKLYPSYEITESDIIHPNTPLPSERDTIKLKGNGSGFFVGSDVVATNYHVVCDAAKIEVVLFNEEGTKRYSAKVWCFDKINDLALLKIEDDKFSKILNIPYEISSSVVDVGTGIYTMGYPMSNIMGQEIKVTDGIISSKSGYEGNIVTYQISAAVQPGNSGAPIFSQQGKLIGIVSSGIAGADNVAYAIKSGYLNNLIQSAPVEIPNILQKKIVTSEFLEQIKLFKPYIVLILVY